MKHKRKIKNDTKKDRNKVKIDYLYHLLKPLIFLLRRDKINQESRISTISKIFLERYVLKNGAKS